MKILIIGIGNNILSDDGAGILVASEVYKKIKKEGVDFIESCYAGWRCVDFFKGYDRIIIIDVICDKDRSAGECYKLELPESISLHLQSSHNTGFFESLELARQSGLLTSDNISIYAITAKNVSEFSEEICPEIKDNVSAIVDEIVNSEFAVV